MLLRLFCFYKNNCLSFFFSTSCSTFKLSSREKIYSSTVLGFAGGAAYGLSRSEAKGKNALLFGSSLGLMTSLISIAIFNEERKAKELEEKLSKARRRPGAYV